MNIDKLTDVRPSKRQMIVQQMEFYGFIHFGMNTYTKREWGTGQESPDLFALEHFNAKQIVNSIKDGGMSGVIYTAKHHDGFCMWNTKYTDHSITSSPYEYDILEQLAAECHKQGIKLGIYLSPWDMNSPVYGQGEAYDDFFINQLSELLTNYGDIFCVWFDGACGEGANGKKQIYDWERYYEVIRKLQPNACIHVCGPDIRWCGNEAGITRESEWSVVPKELQDKEKIHERSQQQEGAEFRNRALTSSDMDLGSRTVIEGVDELVWYPAEVDVSIRPGWFYHEKDDEKVKDFDTLKKLYYASVGGNATLLLNIPPNRNGEIHSRDAEELKKLGDFIKCSFANNLIDDACLSTNVKVNDDSLNDLKYDNYDHYFVSSQEHCEINVKLSRKQVLNHLVLKENINLSQRIESFKVEFFEGEEKVHEIEETTIGYKKIIPIEGIGADEIKITILQSRSKPIISFIGIY